MRFGSFALALVCVFAPARCVEAAPETTSAVAVSTTSTAPLPPLHAEWLEPLGTAAAAGFVAVPIGASEPRPIVIAVHGAGDRPEWSCSEWRAIFGPVPFVVCPRGSALGANGANGFAWSGAQHVERAIAAALAETHGRFAAYLDDTSPRVYVGFSQGARIGAEVVAHAAARYPVAVFLEGLGDVESPSFTAPFRADGKRVLLACSQRGCAPKREKAARVLERKGIAARVLDIGPIGHTVDGRVVEAMRREVPWLLDGVPGWDPVRRSITGT